MLNEIRRLPGLRPFKPFVIHLTNGLALPVLAEDHAAFSPAGGHLVIFENDGTANLLSALHITHVRAESETMGSVS